MSEVSSEDSSLTKLIEGLDVQPLLAAISEQPHLWLLNTWRQDEAGGQQDTEAVMLRWAAENTFASIRDSLSVENTANLPALTAAFPVLDAVTRFIGAQALGRVFIVKLKPGGRVYPHADVGVYADTFERFHLCLQADPEFTYFVQHPTGPIQYANMKAGELWWFNHKRVHWAHNGGASDRISVIIDAVAPAFRKERDQLAVGVGYTMKGSANEAV